MNYRLRVSVKVEQGSNLTLTRDLPYIASIQNWRSVQKWNKTSVLRSTNLAFYKWQWSLESFTDQTFFIAGFQPRDKAAMLVYKTIKCFFAKFACRKSFVPSREIIFRFRLPTNMAAVTSAENQQYIFETFSESETVCWWRIFHLYLK